MDLADELIHPDYAHNAAGIVRIGIDANNDWVEKNRAAFPDFHANMNQIFAEGDKVEVDHYISIQLFFQYFSFFRNSP